MQAFVRSVSHSASHINESLSAIRRPRIPTQRIRGELRQARSRLATWVRRAVTAQVPDVEAPHTAPVAPSVMPTIESCVELSIDDPAITMTPERLDLSGLAAFAVSFQQDVVYEFEERCQTLVNRVINKGQRAIDPDTSPLEHLRLATDIIAALEQIDTLVTELANQHDSTGGATREFRTWAQKKQIHIATERKAWTRQLAILELMS